MGLESKLQEATSLADKSQYALMQCETSLFNCWKMLNEERLELGACQEALSFERERHKDTIDLLERVFKEATRSGEIADSLGSKLAELQAVASFSVHQTAPQTIASKDTSQNNVNSAPPEASTSASQQSDSAKRLLETHTNNSHSLKLLAEAEQATKLSDVPSHVQPLLSAEPKLSSCSGRRRTGGKKGTGIS